jgi:hypothetical protein
MRQLTLRRKLQLFKVIVVAWTLVIVVGLSSMTYLGAAFMLSPEFVMILIFVSMGLFGISGALLCRCPECGATLWSSLLPGDLTETVCPSCRLPLDSGES